VSDDSNDEDIYFQHILVHKIELKIDYRPVILNLQALQGGDYMQLLNIFPLEGLEITLKSIKLDDVRGLKTCADRLLDLWVQDIYSNQLYSVISGTAPFRGISNVGSNLQDLLAIPMKDFTCKLMMMMIVDDNDENADI